MNKETINIWGRTINIDIIFDRYAGESILTSQREALDEILSKPRPFDSVLELVKNYCLEDENYDDGLEIKNIFRYVMPKALYIRRDQHNHVVALLCNYKLDLEHGLAIVYENGVFNKIGNEDIIM